MRSDDEKRFPPANVIARYTFVVLGILILSLLIWVIKDALLTAFGGVILAAIFLGMTKGLQKFLPLSHGLALLTVGVLVVVVTLLFGMLFGPQISREFDQLVVQLPERFTELRETISEWPGGEQVMEEVTNNGGGQPGSDGPSDSGDTQNGDSQNGDSQNGGTGDAMNSITEEMPADASNVILRGGATLIDVLTTIGLVFIVGIYFAINPQLYKKGLLLLVPEEKEERISDVLETSGRALWLWLKGQLIAMAFVGVILTVGLMIIGVPLALVLGIIGGLLEFIPFIGPFLSAVPILLLALSVDTQTAFFAVILLLIVQQLEGNVITPLVQQQMVHLPPSVVILGIMAFGLIFGVAGLILATPLAVVVMVMVGMLYVQDVLGKEVAVPGQAEVKKKEST